MYTLRRNSNSVWLYALGAALLLLCSVRCFAAANVPVGVTVPSFPIPESPAGAAISNNGEPTLRPSTPKEFAASLVGLVDRNGKLKPGVAMQYRLGTSIARMPSDYRENMLTRLRLNTEISFATTVSGQDAAKGKQGQQTALGLKIPIIDNTDPRLKNSNFSRCAEQAYRSGGGVVIPPDAPYPQNEKGNPVIALDGEAVKLALTKCSKAHWEDVKNNPAKYDSLTFAIAQTWADQGTDDKANYQKDARYMWLVYSTGFSSDTKFLIQARAIRDAIDTGTTPILQRKFDSNGASARLFLTKDDYHLSIGYGSQRKKFSFGGKQENVATVTGAVDYKIADEWWLRYSYAQERKSASGTSPVSTVTVNYGKKTEPIHAPF